MPVQAIDLGLGGTLGTLIKIFGISWVVDRFSGRIDDTINRFLDHEGAGIEATTKVVPVIRVGEGLAAGAAQVVGPEEQVNLVQAVAQLGWEPGIFRGRLLLPVST